jgi:hypothetical protein
MDKRKYNKGRPPLPVDKRLSEMIYIRVSREFKDMLRERSARSGVSMAEEIIEFIIAGIEKDHNK